MYEHLKNKISRLRVLEIFKKAKIFLIEAPRKN